MKNKTIAAVLAAGTVAALAVAAPAQATTTHQRAWITAVGCVAERAEADIVFDNSRGHARAGYRVYIDVKRHGHWYTTGYRVVWVPKGHVVYAHGIDGDIDGIWLWDGAAQRVRVTFAGAELSRGSASARDLTCGTGE